MYQKLFQVLGLFFLFSVIVISPVLATNGMNMIGFDAISSGMAGADTAVPTGSSGTALNPAVTLLNGDDNSFIFNVSLLMPNLNMYNETYMGTNDVDGESQIFPLPFLSYATKLSNTNLILGIGIFAQGGMGVDFKDVNTGFGNEDELYSNVSYLKISPTVAYQISEKFSLGASFHIGYASINYKFFNETSYFDPGTDGTPMTADDILFPGQEIKDANGMGYSGRFGFTVSPIENLYLGASYTTKAELDFEGGDLTMNFTSLGMGKVIYDGSVTGFTWPATYDLGSSYYLMDKKLLLAFDFSLIQWSDAIKDVTVKGENPDNSQLPENMQTMEITFPFNWDDQMVYALGIAYSLTDAFTVRGGVNLSNDPIKDEYVNPLFPAIIENHVTLGAGYKTENWSFDIAYERALEVSKKNTNTNQMENPFGPALEVTHNQNTIHLMLGYKW